MVFALLSTIACGPADPTTECREGTTLAADGHCYPPGLQGPVTIADVIDALPPCDPVDANGTIEIATGCVDGACAGQTYAQMRAAIGFDVVCSTLSSDADRVSCRWDALDLTARFDDDNEDGVPDSTETTNEIRIGADHRGGTSTGLGVGASLACFFDELGLPEAVELEDHGGELLFEQLDYDDYGLTVFDRGDDDETGVPNGYIDALYLRGE